MLGFPGGSDDKEMVCSAGDSSSIPGSERSSGGEWQPTLVFLPGEFHGQRSPVSYSPCGVAGGGGARRIQKRLLIMV